MRATNKLGELTPPPLLIAALTVLALSEYASAAPFVILNDINNGGSSYIGPAPIFGSYTGSSLGGVSDGGFDAFDFYGEWTGNGTGLSLSRRVEALSAINVYRFFDTFTNTTGSQITRTLQFQGNLGSDFGTIVDHNSPGLLVSHESFSGGNTQDPVLAAVYGNNAFAAANMSAAVGGGAGDHYVMTLSLSLNPFQSLSILQFVFADRPDTTIINYGTTGTNQIGSYIAAGIATGTNLRSNPYLNGLTQQQINSIANFSAQEVPEPTSIALLGLGGLGLLAARKRRQAV